MGRRRPIETNFRTLILSLVIRIICDDCRFLMGRRRPIPLPAFTTTF
ncbi:MAG: hypothetical protein LZF62_480171 [Nitrospira sp.]|nr:MAG: hypothetical protein LZF62_480171 [Nitrospira sp.]